ncbi:MAG: PEGA domain-containing protein [Candidatus Eisenbacteria bacterium]
MFARRGLGAVAYLCPGLVVALIWLPSIGGCGAKCNSPSEPGNGSANPKGSIEVTSAPPGAAIFLDGVDKGLTTPDTLGDVSVGTHEVWVVLECHDRIPEVDTITVAEGSLSQAVFTLTALPRGSVEVISEPTGASILLDGVETGQVTPDTLTDVCVGDHEIRVMLSGFESSPQSTLVTVLAEGVAEASFVLTPTETGEIAVFSNPPGAAIFLDGLETGRTTPDTLSVDEGEYVVRVALDGYISSPDSIVAVVAAGALIEVQFTLEPPPPPSRLVYIEHFSNTACDPCVEVEENLELLFFRLGFDKAVSVANHLNWPTPADPFYLDNPAQMNERRGQFGVAALPQVFINGVRFMAPEEYDGLLAAVEAAMGAVPFFTVDVSTALQGDSIVASGTVKKLADTAEGDEVLVVAIIETGIEYDATNGLTHFDDILRRYLPGTGGRDLSLLVGESESFRFAAAVSGQWNTGNLEAVAFVESPSTRKVYQAGSTR